MLQVLNRKSEESLCQFICHRNSEKEVVAPGGGGGTSILGSTEDVPTWCLFGLPALAQGVFFELPELGQGPFLSLQL